MVRFTSNSPLYIFSTYMPCHRALATDSSGKETTTMAEADGPLPFEGTGELV